MSRHIVVVDCETTGLEDHHCAIEISWWDLTTGEQRTYIPWFSDFDLDDAALEAMAVNRFYERGLDRAARDNNGTESALLVEALDGNTLAGSNPTFDATMLAKSFSDHGFPQNPWHHRLLDLSAYAAGVLGIDPVELPGLTKVTQLLGVQPGDHTAAEDVRATGECLLELFKIQANRTGESK